MTATEFYIKTHINSHIEVGDTVKVLRTARGGENGWTGVWINAMSYTIGGEFTVITDCGFSGFMLNNGCTFPWFVLELIKKGTNSRTVEELIGTIPEDVICTPVKVYIKQIADLIKKEIIDEISDVKKQKNSP